MMSPVLTETEYRNLRNSVKQKTVMKAVRGGDVSQKAKLLQMNYSCLPNEDGSLKGSKRMSTTVGMDIDWTPSPLPPVIPLGGQSPSGLSGDRDRFSPPSHSPRGERGEEQIAARKEEWLRTVPELVLSRKDELGLLMLERSATKGYHLVFKRRPELTQEENLRWASELLGVPYDEGAKDITRVFFTTTEKELLYLDEEIFKQTPSQLPLQGESGHSANKKTSTEVSTPLTHREGNGGGSGLLFPTDYHGIPFKDIVAKYWEVNNHGFEPTIGDRDTLTYQLACDLRHICGKNADWLNQVIPCYNGFTPEEKRAKIKSALSSEYNGFPIRLRNVLNSLTPDPSPKGEGSEEHNDSDNEEDAVSISPLNPYLRYLSQGVIDSIEAVNPGLEMVVLVSICPEIGALATGVKLDVHGQVRGINLISYVAGDFASNKGDIDPVVDAWMSEVKALDKMYLQQEDDFRAKKRAAKNKKEQPEEPKLPVRFLTLNNTVANLAERLANTEGKHAFSFTPEADTVAQKWRSSMSDFSVMLRQSYDGSRYDREARSAEAVNVHIDHLLWNVTMCGTPDALYRVVSNYTDGFQSRIAIARTPDNTFSPLQEKPRVLTERQKERIQQIAHLLPLMQGEVVLPKLEAKGREWLEGIRLETMKNDDRTKARQRFRVCVTAQRMTCCLMLCKVCETLIKKYGLNGAEARLKQYPNLWKEMLLKTQTPQMMDIYGIIADSLLENALFFFRDRIENAFNSRDYTGCNERQRVGKNDSIFERLDIEFDINQAMQHSIAIKGAGVTRNTVHQMLKNWKRQGLIVQTEAVKYRKVETICH